jgi:hypothetical protein
MCLGFDPLRSRSVRYHATELRRKGFRVEMSSGGLELGRSHAWHPSRISDGPENQFLPARPGSRPARVVTVCKIFSFLKGNVIAVLMLEDVPQDIVIMTLKVWCACVSELVFACVCVCAVYVLVRNCIFIF